ncbi:MAG: hypothetical protein OEU36_09895 [Gammaproteobacteria bacterium]|nr:hypothetical protein [Gammaproteobacteria bacterium]
MIRNAESSRVFFTVASVTLFAAISAFYFYFTWHGEFSDFMSDSAIYLLLADGFFHSEQIPDSLVDFIRSEYPFPPLFPFVLGLFGGGSAHPEISHLVNTVTLLAALFAYYFWSMTELRQFFLAVLLTAVFALLPTTLLHSQIIISEHLYLFLTLLALASFERSTANEKWLLAAAVLVGLSMLTRTVGVALVLAFIVLVVLQNKPKKVVLIGLSVLPQVIWQLYKLSHSYTTSYATDLLDFLSGDPVRVVLEFVQVNGLVIWLNWSKGLDHFLTDHGQLMSAAILCLCALGMMRRLWLLKLDAWYVLIYLCIILVWPHPDHALRFLYVVVPILLLQGLSLFVYVAGRYAHVTMLKLIPGLYIGFVVITMITSSTFIVKRSMVPVDASMAHFAKTRQWLEQSDIAKAKSHAAFMNRFHDSIKATKSYIPKDDCVFSINPWLTMVFAQRKSVEPPRPALSDREFFAQTEQCRYFLLMSLTTVPNLGYPAMYPIERLRDRMRVISLIRLHANDTKSSVVSMLVTIDDG